MGNKLIIINDSIHPIFFTMFSYQSAVHTPILIPIACVRSRLLARFISHSGIITCFLVDLYELIILAECFQEVASKYKTLRLFLAIWIGQLVSFLRLIVFLSDFGFFWGLLLGLSLPITSKNNYCHYWKNFIGRFLDFNKLLYAIQIIYNRLSFVNAGLAFVVADLLNEHSFLPCQDLLKIPTSLRFGYLLNFQLEVSLSTFHFADLFLFEMKFLYFVDSQSCLLAFFDN